MREIPLGTHFEIKTVIGGWDEKWMYLVHYYVSYPSKSDGKTTKGAPSGNMPSITTPSTPSLVDSPPRATSPPPVPIVKIPYKAPPTVSPRKIRRALPEGSLTHCIAVSLYCFKTGRITIPPRVAFITAGFGDPSKQRWFHVQGLRFSKPDPTPADKLDAKGGKGKSATKNRMTGILRGDWRTDQVDGWEPSGDGSSFWELREYEQRRVEAISNIFSDMKSASDEVVTKAVDLILEDIALQNGGQILKRSRPSSDTDIERGALDCRIESLFEVLRCVERHIQSHISQARRHRNNMSFIHGLPVEILTEIFRSVTNAVAATHYYRVLATLSTVCTRWAGIIDQASSLWTVIFDHYDLHLADKIIDRWKVAELTLLSSDIPHLEAYLGGLPAPRLKRLQIVLEDGSDSSVGLFRGGAGHLEELDLLGVSVHWTSPLLSGLRSLRLEALSDSIEGVTTDRLLTVLMQCPHLAELRVENCEFHGSSTSNDVVPAHIELPHLNVLEFYFNIPPTTAYSVLSHISAPKYTFFHVLTDSHREPPSSDILRSSIPRHVPSLKHLITSAGKIEITLALDYSQYITCSLEGEPSLELKIEHSSSTNTLAYIADAFAGILDGVETEVIIDHYRQLSPEDIATICRVPLITTLNISGNQTSLIHHLSHPTLVSGKLHWPLPALAVLRIDADHHTPREILWMVERRYGCTSGLNEAASTTHLPVRFSSLIIYGSGTSLDDQTLQQIRSIIGDDHLERIETDLDPDFDFNSDI
ncbi:hypothetical protein FRB99_002497 [Tulasnella sp. 403]|nr:hypothetical protein FRB99_002497 [Tulasnella sp. 403]